MTTNKEPDASVQSEAEGNDLAMTVVNLGDVKIAVLPMDEWQTVALTAARNGDFDGWAAGALDDDSFDTWVHYGPRIREATAAFEEWMEASGFSKELSRSQRRQLERSKDSRRK